VISLTTNSFFPGELYKQQFTLSPGVMYKYLVVFILVNALFDVALLIFHFPIFPILILKGIGFVFVGAAPYFMLRFRQAEKELRQQDFFRKNPSPMWICDSGTHKLLEANEAATITFGYSSQEFLQMSIDDLIILDDPLGRKEDVSGQRSELSGTRTIQCKDGSSIKVKLAYFQVTYKSQNAGLITSNNVIERPGHKKFIDNEFVQQINDRIAELILTKKELEIRNREINATNDELINLSNLLQNANKKLAEQSAMAIHQNMEQFKRILNQVNDSIWSFDLNGEGGDFVNTSTLALFGISREKIIDCPNFWLDFIHPTEKEFVFEKLKILETQDETGFSYQMLDSKKGTKRIYQRVNIIRDHQGKAVRMECIGRPN
jgi:PAS domain S-box-containing protein